MRGFPLINLLLVITLIALTAIPLVRLSGEPNASPPTVAQSPAPEEQRSTQFAVKLAHAATSVAIRKGDRLLHEWKPAADLDLKATLEAPIADSVLEFEVSIDWPEGTPHSVAEVTVEPDGLDSRQANIWGTGPTVEVLNFQWQTNQ